MNNKSILLVDDDINILRAFRRLFLDRDYDLFLAASGQDALEILAKKKIDLFISDMRMPHMNGYELLSLVKKKYPNTLRVILSGFAEKDLMVKSIQENLAITYLLKPWDNEKILNSIDNLLKVKEILSNNHLTEMMYFMGNKLSNKNKSFKKLLKQIKGGCEIKELIKTIEDDIGLSAMILHFVNSAFHGYNISSVEKALEFISTDELKDIIKSEQINLLAVDCKDCDTVKNNLEGFSRLANKITHFIYKEIVRREIPENYRLVGLLSNIGMLFLLNIYKNDYRNTIYYCFKEGIPIERVEKEKYGIDHQEVGGYLLSLWGIPYPIVEAAFYHHNPSDSNIINKELINIIHIATHYACILYFEKSIFPINNTAFSNIGVTRELCEDKIFNKFSNIFFKKGMLR